MIPPIQAKRAQFFFSDQRKEWSEVYWQSPNVSFAETVLRATKLADLRVQMLAVGVQLTEIRVSDDSVFRDSEVTTDYANWAAPGGANPTLRIYNDKIIQSDNAGLNGDAADPNYCLRIRQEGKVQDVLHMHRRIIYMSGLPKSLLIDQGNVPPFKNKAFGTAFNTWKTYLNENQDSWGFCVFHTPAVNEKFQIHDITRATLGGPVVINTVQIPAVQKGDTLAVFRPGFFPGSLKIQGKYEVQDVTGDAITVNDPRVGAVNYHDGGVIWKVTREWAAIWDVIDDGFSSKKRGSAELAPRGRLRSRRNFAG